MSEQPADNLTSYLERVVSDAADARDESEVAQLVANSAAEMRERISAERLAAASRIAAWLAHKINNPLGTISGNAQLLARRLERDISDPDLLPTYLRYIEGIQNETERCAQITADLLSFARPRNLDIRKVDLKQAVEEAVELSRYGRGNTRIAVGPGFADGVPGVLADKELFVRVVYEVLVNAIQATPKDGTITVDAETVPGGAECREWVCLKVADSGAGIPGEVLPRIFDPFFSTREKARGLGLTVGLETMRQMGGTIEVSETGCTGTVVAIRVRSGRRGG